MPTSETWEFPSLSLQAIMMDAAARWKRKLTSLIFRSSSAKVNRSTLSNIWILASLSSRKCTPNVCKSNKKMRKNSSKHQTMYVAKKKVTFFIHSITRVRFWECLLFATNLSTRGMSKSIFSDNFTKLYSRILLKLFSNDVILMWVSMRAYKGKIQSPNISFK